MSADPFPSDPDRVIIRRQEWEYCQQNLPSLHDMQTFGGELAKEARELINLQRAAELEISHPTDGEPVVNIHS